MIPEPTFDRALAFARDLIRIPGLPGAEGDVARRLLTELDALGFDDAWSDDVGNVIGRVRGTGDGASVMLSCHLDCVDVGDVSTWEHPPFDGVIADGCLHGRGAMDIKGPLALQTYAAARCLQHRLEGDVWVAHTVQEERGGWGMQHLLETADFRPGAVIIGESTHGDVCIGHRGRAEILVELTGVAGHASAPERAANPLALLPALLPAIDRFAMGLDAHPLLGKPSLAPTAVETLPASRNVIPDLVRVVIDWRVHPDTTTETAAAGLEAFLREAVPVVAPLGLRVRYATEHQHTWTGLDRVRDMFTPGFVLAPDHPVVTAATTALEAHGQRPRVRPWTFATDGGHTCGVHGIPTFGFAPGEERFAHTNRERLDLDEARRAFEAYPALIAAVRAAA
ncbi:MAG: M20/M25/M40 family metallo-hydrolase [Gemmatimonadota bacterium]|jgi:putative selenium metabolism hydrolase